MGSDQALEKTGRAAVTALTVPEEPGEEGEGAPALFEGALPGEASEDSLAGSDETDRFGLEALIRLPAPWGDPPVFPGLPDSLQEPLDDP